MSGLIDVRTVSIRLVRVRTLAQASTILSYSPHHNLRIRNVPDLISTYTRPGHNPATNTLNLNLDLHLPDDRYVLVMLQRKYSKYNVRAEVRCTYIQHPESFIGPRAGLAPGSATLRNGHYRCRAWTAIYRHEPRLPLHS